MTKTMRAAFVKAPWGVEVREVAVPQVRPGWVLIKVEACGICGTDMHIARATEQNLSQFPATEWQGFGHEIAGVVVEVGADVSNVKEGDRVALESGSYCGVCEQCRNGRVDLCNRAPNFWKNESMGFADYILVPYHCCVCFDGLSFEVACLAEPLGVALDMTYTADIQLGNEVLVLGLGPIGLMSIPLARLKGASRIYAVNRSGGQRFELAKKYGADEVISTQNTALEKIDFRKGIDRALVSVAPNAIMETMRVMNYGGQIAYIGIAFGEEGRISFDANEFHFKKLQLRASHASPAIYFPTVLQLLKDKQVDGDAIISHTMPLERIKEAILMIRDTRDGVLKVVITP